MAAKALENDAHCLEHADMSDVVAGRPVRRAGGSMGVEGRGGRHHVDMRDVGGMERPVRRGGKGRGLAWGRRKEEQGANAGQWGVEYERRGRSEE